MRRNLPAARWATFTVFLSNGFGFGAWAAAIPPLKSLLGLSAAHLSWALLAIAIGAAVMMQFAGAIVQMVRGTGRATHLSALIYAVVIALPPMAPNIWVLMSATFLFGCINGLEDVAMNAHAATVEQQWKKPIMSSFHAGFSLGGLLGTGFGALTIHLGVPTHLLTLPAAVLILIANVWAGRHLGNGDVRRLKRSISVQLPEKKLLAVAFIAMCCFLIEGAMADWSGVYLTTIGIGAAAAAMGYGAFSATMVIGRLFGDLVVRRLGRIRVVSGGAFLAAVGLLLAVIFPHMVTILAGFALVGIGLANVVPSVFSISAKIGASPATAIASVSTAGYGGMLSGPPLIGAIAAGWSLRGGIAVMACCAALAVVFALTGIKRDQA